MLWQWAIVGWIVLACVAYLVKRLAPKKNNEAYAVN